MEKLFELFKHLDNKTVYNGNVIVFKRVKNKETGKLERHDVYNWHVINRNQVRDTFAKMSTSLLEQYSFNSNYQLEVKLNTHWEIMAFPKSGEVATLIRSLWRDVIRKPLPRNINIRRYNQMFEI